MDLDQQIEEAAGHIRQGRLVAFPTETVYGLGANALDPLAVARIFEAKGRPTFDPLIVHIASLDTLRLLTTGSDERALRLAHSFWPGPLTLVLPRSSRVPGIVCAGLPTVGIRMPGGEIARRLIARAGCPIAAPSANRFGQLSPTTAAHVRKQLPNIDFVLDGGAPSVGIESTVISLNDRGFEILRHGAITREELERVVPYHAASGGAAPPIAAPGMLKSHYSPSKPLYLLGAPMPPGLRRDRAGLLTFAGGDTQGYRYVEHLSARQDLREAAANLFAALHRLEESDADYLVAEPVPRQGIGLAIMDRLTKAAFRYSQR